MYTINAQDLCIHDKGVFTYQVSMCKLDSGRDMTQCLMQVHHCSPTMINFQRVPRTVMNIARLLFKFKLQPSQEYLKHIISQHSHIVNLHLDFWHLWLNSKHAELALASLLRKHFLRCVSMLSATYTQHLHSRNKQPFNRCYTLWQFDNDYLLCW